MVSPSLLHSILWISCVYKKKNFLFFHTSFSTTTLSFSTMQNSALDGSTFDDNVRVTFSADVKDAYDTNIKCPVYLYSYGNATTHHCTVLYFACENSFTIKVDIVGHDDTKKLILRLTTAQWEPKNETTFYCDSMLLCLFKIYWLVLKGVSFKAVIDHAMDLCKSFGVYHYRNNSCQTWNNNFLAFFNLKRRTLSDFVRSFKTASFWGAIVTGIGTLLLAGPKMLMLK